MHAHDVDRICGELRRLANAISADKGPGRDETGGYVDSLTEAAMGITAGLCRIADSIADLADAARFIGNQQ